MHFHVVSLRISQERQAALSLPFSCRTRQACAGGPGAREKGCMDELVATAAVEAMSMDDIAGEDPMPDTTVSTVPTADALPTIDGNAGEPKRPDPGSRCPSAVRGARSLLGLSADFVLFRSGRDLRWRRDGGPQGQLGGASGSCATGCAPGAYRYHVLGRVRRRRAVGRDRGDHRSVPSASLAPRACSMPCCCSCSACVCWPHWPALGSQPHA